MHTSELESTSWSEYFSRLKSIWLLPIAYSQSANSRNESCHSPALIRESLKLPDHSFKSRLSHRLTATQSSLPPTSGSASLIYPPPVLSTSLTQQKDSTSQKWMKTFLFEGGTNIFVSAKCTNETFAVNPGRFRRKAVNDSKGKLQ